MHYIFMFYRDKGSSWLDQTFILNSMISRVFIAIFPLTWRRCCDKAKECVKFTEIYANNNVGGVFAFKLKQYKLL